MTEMDKLAPYFDAYSEKIKQRRNELGLTVSELSEKSGVPYSNVSRVNSGAQANPLLFNEAAVAQTLGLSLDQLCGLTAPAGDESSLREEIHELQIVNAQKDAEIQRLKGELNTANERAKGYKRLDEAHSAQLAAQTPVSYIQLVINVVLIFFSVIYLIIDVNIQDAGLIRFGNLSIFAWILILIILAACVVVVVNLRQMFKARRKTE